MKDDPLLKKFVEGRNTVVKKGNLKAKSHLEIGMNRYDKMKLASAFEKEDKYLDTIDIFAKYKDFYVNTIIGTEHNACGEQFGVRREWIVADLGDIEVLCLCIEAWIKIGDVVNAAHEEFGLQFVPPKFPDNVMVKFDEKTSMIYIDTRKVCLKLETDYNPSLMKKWGWE